MINTTMLDIINDIVDDIVYGTKIISKCDKEDKFSKETGFLMCMLKKVYGNTKSHKMLEEFVYSTEKKVESKDKKKGKK